VFGKNEALKLKLRVSVHLTVSITRYQISAALLKNVEERNCVYDEETVVRYI
jgi:hypothetical protein